MTDEAKKDLPSLEISAKGFSAKGEAYEDLRPAIVGSVKLAETVLSVVNNVVGLPADYINHHLQSFRQQFKQKVEAIPEEKRCEPPLRLGCGVLKEVAAAAEEPEIQRMFAELLGSGCNVDTKDAAHPGFAAVINQLTSADARVLKSFARGHYDRFDRSNDLSIDNLMRLGLIEWHEKKVGWSDANRLRVDRRRQHISTMRHTVGSRDPLAIANTVNSVSQDLNETVRAINRIGDDLDGFAEKVSRLVEGLGEKSKLVLTDFGKQFLKTCVPRDGLEGGER